MLKWLRSLLTDAVKTILLSIVATTTPPALVVWARGVSYITTAHAVPGWLVLVGAALAGLSVFSAVLNVAQWLRGRRAARQTLRIVAEGMPMALRWSMGSRMDTKAKIMQVSGDFHVTNITQQNVTAPRAILVVSYRRWRLIPWRLRVEATGPEGVLPARHLSRQHPSSMIEPATVKAGDALRAKVGLIDNFGHA